jgi:hypothetical protein
MSFFAFTVNRYSSVGGNLFEKFLRNVGGKILFLTTLKDYRAYFA